MIVYKFYSIFAADNEDKKKSRGTQKKGDLYFLQCTQIFVFGNNECNLQRVTIDICLVGHPSP